MPVGVRHREVVRPIDVRFLILNEKEVKISRTRCVK